MSMRLFALCAAMFSCNQAYASQYLNFSTFVQGHRNYLTYSSNGDIYANEVGFFESDYDITIDLTKLSSYDNYQGALLSTDTNYYSFSPSPSITAFSVYKGAETTSVSFWYSDFLNKFQFGFTYKNEDFPDIGGIDTQATPVSTFYKFGDSGVISMKGLYESRDGVVGPVMISYADSASFVGLRETFSRITNPTLPIPEPATWVLMMIGFGGVGASLRHRQRNVRVDFA